jgi:hypothetical protein
MGLVLRVYPMFVSINIFVSRAHFADDLRPCRACVLARASEKELIRTHEKKTHTKKTLAGALESAVGCR